MHRQFGQILLSSEMGIVEELRIVHQTAFKDNPKGEVAAEIMINYLFTEAAQETPPETTPVPPTEVRR